MVYGHVGYMKENYANKVMRSSPFNNIGDGIETCRIYERKLCK